MNEQRLRNQLQGCSNLFEAFSHLFSIGVDSLLAGDVQTLRAQEASGAPVALEWRDEGWWVELLDHVDVLAQRDRQHRYDFHEPERARLLELAGSLDARGALLTALAIDQAVTQFPIDFGVAPTRARDAGIIPVPEAYLRGSSTLPPALGQMTSLAVARRWLRHLWFMGDVASFEGFGRLPKVRAASLPTRTELALKSAVEEGRLRVGFVRWPSHEQADMVVQSKGRTFGITGYRNVDQALLASTIRNAIDHQVHVLIGPEVALTEENLNFVAMKLREEGSRFPAISIWGLTHRTREVGYANEAVLLDSEGREHLRHEKLEPFTHDTLGLEDIVPRASRDYAFLDTPVGRLVLNVCRDFRSDIPMLLNRVIGATFLAVPAYSRELSFVEEEARVLGARQSAITASTNAAGPGVRHPLYMYAPIRGRDECSVGPALTDLAGAAPLTVVELCHNPSSLTVVHPSRGTS